MPPIAFAARRALGRDRPDVVLAMHTMAAPGALVGSRAPVVLMCHGGELRSARIRRVARWAIPRAYRVVANSRFTRSEAVALGADPMKVIVLPVGAPDPVEVPASAKDALRASLDGEGPIILSVSRLEDHKGHDRLIRSLPADARLVLVGQGTAQGSLADLARTLGRRVIFAGSVGDAELPVYYAAADAFALLSRATLGPGGGVEGGGIALLEACAYGLPIVAGATGGIPETVVDGETGLLVDPDDGSAVTRALDRVLHDAALRARIGGNARRMATGERSWARFVERIEHVMATAAGRA